MCRRQIPSDAFSVLRMFRAKSVKHDHRTKIARVDQQILSASVTYINRGVNTIGALHKVTFSVTIQQSTF
jgi:hypothetical protein